MYLPRSSKKDSLIEYGLTAVLVLLVVLGIYIRAGIYPFGDAPFAPFVSNTDSVGLLSWFSQVLHGRSSVAYSMNFSLGSGLAWLATQLFLYPLHWCLAFIDPVNTLEYLSLFFLLQSMLACLSCLALLRAVYDIPMVVRMLFSLAYALSAASIVFASHVQYAPGVVFLPLVFLGLYRILQAKPSRLFFLSWCALLCMSLHAAWVVFLIMLCALAALIVGMPSYRSRLSQHGPYALASFFAALICAALFYIPLAVSDPLSFAHIIDLHVAQSPDPLDPYLWLRSLHISGFAQDMPYQAFALSSIVVASAFGFVLLGSRQRLRLRLTLAALALGAWLSLSYEPLIRLWFVFSSSDAQISPVYLALSFMAIQMAALYIHDLVKLSHQEKVQGMLAPCVLLILILLCIDVTDSFKLPGYSALQAASLLVVMGCLSFILIDYALRSIPASTRIGLSLVLLVAASGEMAASCIMGLHAHEEGGAISLEQSHEQLESLVQATTSLRHSPGALRCELIDNTPRRPANLSSLYHDNLLLRMRGINQPLYDPSFAGAEALLHRLGYGSPLDQKGMVTYKSPLFIPDSFFGVESLISEDVPYGMERSGEIVMPWPEKNRSLWKAQQPCSIAYGIAREAEAISWTENSFSNQQAWMEELFGLPQPLYKREQIYGIHLPTMLSPDIVMGLARLGDPNKLTQRSYEITSSFGGPLYVQIKTDTPSALLVDGRILAFLSSASNDTNTIYLGEKSPGELTRIQIRANPGSRRAALQIEAASLHTDAANWLLSSMQSEQLSISYWSHTQLKGSIQVGYDRDVIVSIPYDKNWSLKVDGQQHECFDYEGLIRFSVDPGAHVIELKYRAALQYVSLCLVLIGPVALWFVLGMLARRFYPPVQQHYYIFS